MITLRKLRDFISFIPLIFALCILIYYMIGNLVGTSNAVDSFFKYFFSAAIYSIIPCILLLFIKPRKKKLIITFLIGVGLICLFFFLDGINIIWWLIDRESW